MDDDLLRMLKSRAAAERRTMQDLVNDLLRHALAKSTEGPRYRLQMLGWRAALRPGIDILDRGQLLDILDGRTLEGSPRS